MRKMKLYDFYGGCNVNHGDDDDDNDDFNDDDDVHAAASDNDVGSGNNGVIGNDNGDDFIC